MLNAANQTMDTVAKLGISMKEVTDKLTDDGVRLFAEAFDKLLEAVEKSSNSQITSKVSQQTYKLPDALAAFSKNQSSMTGGRREKCAAYGSTMLRFGRTPTKPNGWAGSTSRKTRSP